MADEQVVARALPQTSASSGTMTQARDVSRSRHSRRFAACLGSVFLLLLTPVAPVTAQGDLPAAGQRLQAGLAAAASGDHASYLAHAAAAAVLVPPHPILYYHLARAAALAGRPDSALAALDRVAALGTPRDPATDSAFVSMWSLPEFHERAAALAATLRPFVASDTAFVIDRPNLVVENLAFDYATGAFYAGSMARREILSVSASGRATTLVPARADIGQPLGMRVDPSARTLWAAAIWPADSARRLLQRSALLEIDIATGRVRARYTPADATRPHVLNDIAIAADGGLYVSDSDARAVWHLPRGGSELELWLQFDSTVVYPNGIAVSADQQILFVAHQTGILAIHRESRSVEPLVPPENATLMGIDGLYATRYGLIGVQNSLPVEQVVRIRIDGRSTRMPRVTCVEVLEREHPAFVIPTTGTLVDGDLLYVANSELRRLDARGTLTDPGNERRTVILRLDTDGRSSAAQAGMECGTG